MQNLTIIRDKLHSFNIDNIQDDQWWAFCETVQKISKITQYTASRFSLLTSAKFAAVRAVVECLNEHQQRVTLQHNKEFIMFIFYSVIL